MPGLDIDQLLKGLQAFFHGYTQIVPSPKPDDKPYRTAKTVLFHLTEHMGSEVCWCVCVCVCVYMCVVVGGCACVCVTQE